MRFGGLQIMARLWLSDSLRSWGIGLSARFAKAADWVDPMRASRAKPAREWNPRLWDRDGDPRADAEERP
ncbi:hypothetical protein [Methylobacterium sp. Leaf108]|uniref:hypothetical protein n=1 Tax=Methylobacterium sp. Leaf108 TaxID=1736256 RepID=UPI0006FBD9FE|nr:hypothetical protein [Methylobacterium sp. Leaf108]KQP61083.1 hypothetical protein ASF39_15540 [Methylobacterium sp. Leaf108]